MRPSSLVIVFAVILLAACTPPQPDPVRVRCVWDEPDWDLGTCTFEAPSEAARNECGKLRLTCGYGTTESQAFCINITQGSTVLDVALEGVGRRYFEYGYSWDRFDRSCRVTWHVVPRESVRSTRRPVRRR